MTDQRLELGASRHATERPKLTIAILTYNSGATIASCLASLAEQECKAFQVLVVDDDSVDDTLEVVSTFASELEITVARNGSHSIPRGRNIGLSRSGTDIVAFLDSDDSALPTWTRVILETLEGNSEIACISGELLPAYRTTTAQAIALNDDTVRRCFGGHSLFSAGNCAINLAAFPGARFDEDFRFAEDLELLSRFGRSDSWRHVPGMRIKHFSRDTLREYAVQMYRYGFMKQYFAFSSGSYRWLDFVPLTLLLGGVVASLVAWVWWPLILVVALSLLEAAFVVAYQRCPLRVAPITFPAWLVKNFFWSCGVTVGLVALAVNRETRQLLRSKRAGSSHVTAR